MLRQADASNIIASGLTLGTIYAGQSASVTLTLSNVTSSNNFRGYIYASATSAGANSSSGVLVASPSGYSYYSSISISTTITKATLNSAGFPSGSQVYLVGYGGPYYATTYTDPTTGRIVYTGLNTTASPVITFIVP